VRRYWEERKATLIKRMMLPLNTPVMKQVEKTGISDVTLYTRRKQARESSLAVPGNGKNPKIWSSQDKFRVILETASMNKGQLAEHCHKKGLYAE
jgi:transposase